MFGVRFRAVTVVREQIVFFLTGKIERERMEDSYNKGIQKKKRKVILTY